MDSARPRLAAISVHPVKSTATRPVASAQIGPSGLVGDREWMVVDGQGSAVTARELAALLHVTATNPATGGRPGVDLHLEAPGAGGIDLMIPHGENRGVRLFGQDLVARPAGAHADAWLRCALGRDDLSLVWCAEPEQRQVDFARRPTDTAAFQDESAVSLVSTASIAQLNEWVGGTEPLPASRFRASLLVEGAAPFAEDGWGAVRIGEAELRVAGPIGRCMITGIDPVTLARGKDPIRTLAKHRRRDGTTWFAVHLLVDRPGRVCVGDAVEVGR